MLAFFSIATILNVTWDFCLLKQESDLGSEAWRGFVVVVGVRLLQPAQPRQLQLSVHGITIPDLRGILYERILGIIISWWPCKGFPKARGSFPNISHERGCGYCVEHWIHGGVQRQNKNCHPRVHLWWNGCPAKGREPEENDGNPTEEVRHDD